MNLELELGNSSRAQMGHILSFFSPRLDKFAQVRALRIVLAVPSTHLSITLVTPFHAFTSDLATL